MENLELPSFAGPEIAGPVHGDAPFVLAGRRALVTGLEATGVEELRVHPYRVLRRLRLAEGVAVAARATPAGFERRIELDGRLLVERIFVPDAAPGAILEWEVFPGPQASSTCLAPLELELEWRCDLEDGAGAAPGLRGHASGRRLVVEAADGRAAAFEANRTLSAAVEVPPPGAAAGPGVRCRAGVRLVPGERFRLSVAAAPAAAGLEAALAALANAVATVQARAATAQRALGADLALGTPAPGAGQALRWALLRLSSFVAELSGAGEAALAAGYAPGARPAASAAAALRVGLAALAAGEPRLALEAARCTLAEAERGGAGDGAGAPALLLHAAHFLWTGDAHPARAAWPRLVALAGRLAADAALAPARGRAERAGTAAARDASVRSAAAASGAALAAAALVQLALAAESLGQAADATALRNRATPLARADAAARALAEAGGWGAWAGGTSEAAAAAWLERAAGGLTPARALWHGPAGISDAAVTAEVIAGAAHGLLGLEPDAPRGRLRLRPQIPAAWDRVDVEHIRLADAEIRLGYTRRDGVHRFEIEQLAGAVPVRAVLEPAVPGIVRAARVDGSPASLNPLRWGERTLVPVQIVLDERRVLEVEVALGAAGDGSRA